MHSQVPCQAIDVQHRRRRSFAVQGISERLLCVDFNARQLPANRGLFQRRLSAIEQQHAERRHHVAIRRRHDGDIQQAIVNEGIRTDDMAAPGLSAIAAGQPYELAPPIHICRKDARLHRFNLPKFRDTRE